MFLDFIRISFFIFILIPIGISQEIDINSKEDLSYKERLDGIMTKLNRSDIKPRRRMALQLNLATLLGYNHPSSDSLINETQRQAVKHGATFYIARSKHLGLMRKKSINQIDSSFLRDIRIIQSIRDTFNNHLLDKWVNQDLGIYYTIIGDYDKAESYFDTTQQIIEKHQNGKSGSLYTYKGMLFQRKREYKKAIENYNLALTQPVVGKKFIFNSLAKLYIEMGNLQKASELAHQALNRKIHSGRDADIESHAILGDIALINQDTSLALSNYQKAESTRSAGLVKNFGALDKVLKILIAKKEFAEAKKLLKDIDDYRFTDSYASLLVTKGIVETRDKNLSTALTNCKEGFDIAQRSIMLEVSLYACTCLIDVSKKQNQLDQTIFWLERKEEVQRAYNEERNIRELASEVARHEVNEEMLELNQANELKEIRIGQKNNIIGVITGGALLLGLLLYRIYKQKSVISDQNAVISNALKEKDTLLREIHHRVKNNLQVISSLLRIQSNQTTYKIAVEALNEGQSRVQTMSLIHQDLYQKDNLRGIKMTTYLDRLTNSLFNTYNISKKRIQLQTKIDDISLDVDTVVPLGLIINELVTNALKYAFSDGRQGLLTVELIESKEGLELFVKDNGIGISDPSSLEKGETFGYNLINAFCHKLDANLTIESSNGTQVSLLIKEYSKVDLTS